MPFVKSMDFSFSDEDVSRQIKREKCKKQPGSRLLPPGHQSVDAENEKDTQGPCAQGFTSAVGAVADHAYAIVRYHRRR